MQPPGQFDNLNVDRIFIFDVPLLHPYDET